MAYDEETRQAARLGISYNAEPQYGPEPEDTRQVQREVNRLRDEVGRLGDVVTKLDKRLQRVTTDAPPQEEKSQLAEVQPVAQHLLAKH